MELVFDTLIETSTDLRAAVIALVLFGFIGLLLWLSDPGVQELEIKTPETLEEIEDHFIEISSSRDRLLSHNSVEVLDALLKKDSLNSEEAVIEVKFLDEGLGTSVSLEELIGILKIFWEVGILKTSEISFTDPGREYAKGLFEY